MTSMLGSSPLRSKSKTDQHKGIYRQQESIDVKNETIVISRLSRHERATECLRHLIGFAKSKSSV
jgi:hypothetical protein